jgi:hypothetical protein
VNQKTKPLQLIASGQIGEALDLLDQMLIHGLHYSELLQFKFRHNDLQRKIRSGSIEHALETKDMNALSMHLIEFVDQIEEQEFLSQILLVSPDQTAHAFVASQLRLLFPNVVEDFSGKKMDGDYAFVVINDLYTNPDMVDAFDKLIDDYVTQYYLVVATSDNRKAVVNNHRSKIHAANSVIALPARIREMMDFIRYFKPV